MFLISKLNTAEYEEAETEASNWTVYVVISDFEVDSIVNLYPILLILIAFGLIVTVVLTAELYYMELKYD